MMYLKNKEHNPPHIHAFYGNEGASFYILNGELYEGSLPTRAKKDGERVCFEIQKRTIGNVGDGEIY